MNAVVLFGGLSWDPGIRGILIVMVGVVVLCGSTYLILGTNLGARLGLLVALTGLFGWMVILTLVWWLSPPAIGPRGNNPSWEAVEVYVNGPETPRTEQVGRLIEPSDLPSADLILAENPELVEEFPNGFVLSDLVASHPEIVAQYIDEEALDGWRLVASSEAGESQATADVILVDNGIFGGPTEYKKLDTWEYGGKARRQDKCADSDLICRAIFRVTDTFQFRHPEHFAVVQVQAVIPQTPVVGQPPPLPRVDPAEPVISVVMVRDLGDVRFIPFLYFVISLALFVLFAWILHNRDKTLMLNRAAAEAASKGA